MKQRSKADWLAALEEAQVPCGPINDLGEVFADPHVQSRQMTVSLDHPLAGTLSVVASPMKLSATPVQYRRAPPLLGQHTEEVLAEFGIDGARLAALREQGAFGRPAGSTERH